MASGCQLTRTAYQERSKSCGFAHMAVTTRTQDVNKLLVKCYAVYERPFRVPVRIETIALAGF